MKTALFVSALAFSCIANAGNEPDVPALKVSEQGIGPLDANTPFNREAIQRLLPDMKVRQSVSSTEGEDFPVLLVSDKIGLLFTINPSENGKIFSVVLERDRVANEFGHKTGQTYRQVFQGASGECSAGMEEYSGTVLCVAPGSKHVHYLFVGRWNGSDGSVPPLKFLNNWKITSIVWKP